MRMNMTLEIGVRTTNFIFSLRLLPFQEECPLNFTCWRDLFCNFLFIWYSYLLDDTFWIDVCPSDGNLVAAGGLGGIDETISIFDRRELGTAQTFDEIHTRNILDLFNKWFLTSTSYFIEKVKCVRWSPSGDMLVTASEDKTVALLDFKTGKTLYTGNTSDGSKFSLFD